MAIAHSRETECDIEIALDKDGIILGLRGDIWVDIGAYVRPNGMTPVRNVAQFHSGPYRVPNIQLERACDVTNKTPSGTYRGPGPVRGLLLHGAAARHGREGPGARSASRSAGAI